MTVILGINAYHADAAACLLIDGQLVGAVAEERMGDRQKHSSAFPANAIRWLLEDNQCKLSDVTHLAIPRNTAANRMAKLNYTLKHPITGLAAAMTHFSRSRDTSTMINKLAMICDADPANVHFQTVAVEHHLAHIASSYYCSPFDRLTAGFSYDASGDFASAMAAKCEGTEIKVVDRVCLPDSLGFFYTALCQFIGFDAFGEEYKVMGLASYGEDNYHDEMAKLLYLHDNGWFKLNSKYFGMHNGRKSGDVDTTNNLVMGQLYKNRMIELFGSPAERGHLGQREKDIARSTQLRFEKATLHCLNRLHHLVPTENLAMAGGCALNGVANARILRESAFTTTYLQAASSDDGTCLGAAFWVWHNTLGQNTRFHMKHNFWGPQYSDQDHRKAVEKTGLKIQICQNEQELVDVTAKLITEGRVIGWYQGRSEWGPRALGNRSILANPSQRDMKNVINTKIKRRESFRPFAPSVLKEDVATYFEQNIASPFMMHVVKIKPEWQDRLPAITHVDGTGRLQSVDAESNPLYYKLINALKKLTGIGMVLNTSFNENEPIVDRPEQAVSCFMRTDMDALVLGRYIIRKPSIA